MSVDTDSDTNRGRTDAATRPPSGKSGMAATNSEPTGLFERVLVVTDGDTTGDAAVAAGVDLAATHGASVDAL